jgi:hypothetical protein
MVSKFSVMLVAFVKCMFHNNLIDGPTVQPLYVKSKKQTFCHGPNIYLKFHTILTRIMLLGNSNHWLNLREIQINSVLLIGQL